MTLFEMTFEERREYVTKLLNYDPLSPESWPDSIIDDLLRRAERAARDRLMSDVALVGGHGR